MFNFLKITSLLILFFNHIFSLPINQDNIYFQKDLSESALLSLDCIRNEQGVTCQRNGVEYIFNGHNITEELIKSTVQALVFNGVVDAKEESVKKKNKGIMSEKGLKQSYASGITVCETTTECIDKTQSKICETPTEYKIPSDSTICDTTTECKTPSESTTCDTTTECKTPSESTTCDTTTECKTPSESTTCDTTTECKTSSESTICDTTECKTSSKSIPCDTTTECTPPSESTNCDITTECKTTIESTTCDTTTECKTSSESTICHTTELVPISESNECVTKTERLLKTTICDTTPECTHKSETTDCTISSESDIFNTKIRGSSSERSIICDKTKNQKVSHDSNIFHSNLEISVPVDRHTIQKVKILKSDKIHPENFQSFLECNPDISIGQGMGNTAVYHCKWKQKPFKFELSEKT